MRHPLLTLGAAALLGAFAFAQDPASSPEPDAVAAAFLEALTTERPRRRYLVVPNRDEAMLTLRAAMQRVVQLNDGQPFQLGRDELVRLLDEALARTR